MAAEIRISINSTASGSAVADAKKDVADLGSTAEKSGKGFSALKEIGIGALRELGAAATNAALGGLKALGGAVMDGIADAREAAKINAQTAAVLKSTGQAAGVSAEHIQEYAASLSAAAGKSLFGDSQIQESENLLLTFTNIKGATLDAATAISVDMAQALGGAPKDSAIQLGKALNDPIKGITALTRVGVTFSQDQKDMIQALVETGDVAGAQAVIIEELNKEFGGSAEAAAKADGGWAQFNDRLGEAKETIGAAILPLLSVLAGFLNDSILPAVEAAAAAFSAWLADPATQAGIQQIVTLIQQGLATALAIIVPLVQGVVASFAAGGDPIQGFIDVISQVSPIIGALITVFQTVLPSILYIVQSVFGDIQAFFQANGAQMLAAAQTTWQSIQATIQAIIDAVVPVVQAFLTQLFLFWQAHGEEIMATVQVVWNEINSIIQLAMQLIQATIVPMLQGIAAFISSHSAEIQTVFSIAWEAIKTIVLTVLSVIRGIITAALALVKGDWEGAWTAIKGIATTAWDAIKTLFKLQLDLIYLIWGDAWEKVKVFFQGIMDGIVGWVLQTFQGVVNAIKGFAGEARSAAGGVADAIVNGISSGISNGASAIINAAKDAAMSALDAAKSALGISSPSKVFADLVGKPMAEGMALGLAGGAPMVAGAAQYAAGAGYAGASSTVSSYRTLNYSPTYNTNAAPQEVDAALLSSLAGV